MFSQPIHCPTDSTRLTIHSDSAVTAKLFVRKLGQPHFKEGFFLQVAIYVIKSGTQDFKILMCLWQGSD